MSLINGRAGIGGKLFSKNGYIQFKVHHAIGICVRGRIPFVWYKNKKFFFENDSSMHSYFEVEN